MENPQAFLSSPDLFLKHSEVATIARVPSDHPLKPGLVLRRLNYGRALDRLRDTFRPSRVRRAMANALELQEAGIPTPTPLAATEVRSLGVPLEAYLITEEVPGARTLGKLFADNRRRIPRAAVLRLADILALLHQRGFAHRDLKWSNILWDRDLQPYLIDLDGMKKRRKVSYSLALADLARLGRQAVPHPNFLKHTGARFLRRYCQQRGVEGQFRRWWEDLGREITARFGA